MNFKLYFNKIIIFVINILKIINFIIDNWLINIKIIYININLNNNLMIINYSITIYLMNYLILKVSK